MPTTSLGLLLDDEASDKTQVNLSFSEQGGTESNAVAYRLRLPGLLQPVHEYVWQHVPAGQRPQAQRLPGPLPSPAKQRLSKNQMPLKHRLLIFFNTPEHIRNLDKIPNV